MLLIVGLFLGWLAIGLFFTILLLVVCLFDYRPVDWTVWVVPLFGPLVFVGLVAMILQSNENGESRRAKESDINYAHKRLNWRGGRVHQLVGDNVECIVVFETYSAGSQGAWSEKVQNKREAMKKVKAFLKQMEPIKLDRDGEWFIGKKLRDGRVQLYAGIFPIKAERAI